MKLFYFGDPSGRIFGASEAARVASSRPKVVVLCYPMGQEQIRAHRAFRNLSMRLSKAGWHVLRFDYFGCGDSAGESDEGDADQWMSDVVAAIEQARLAHGLAKVSLIGLRLGATLATLVASQRNDIDQLVLWDPILDGRGFLEELSASHRAWLARRAEMGWDPPKQDDEVAQVLGFPLTNGIRKTLEEIDLLGLSKRPARNVLIIEADEDEDARRLEVHLRVLDCDVEYQCLPEAKIWLRLTMNQRVVPNQTLEQIVAWLARTDR